MENFTAICRQYTRLRAMQCELLKRLVVCIPFLADLVHAQVRVFVLAREARRFFMISRQRPHTIFIPKDALPEGTLVAAQEEPLIAYTFRTGKSIRGKREWQMGSSLDMYTYPIFDGNEVVAVASFEMNPEDFRTDGSPQLLAAAEIILDNARKELDEQMYRPLSSSDGVLIADQYNRIIFANTAAIRIYRVLGVSNLLGWHLFDRQLTMHVRKETTLRDRPYEKEIEAGELTLVQRNLPILEGGKLMRRIVIISDVTELRKKDQEIRIKSAVIQEIHHRVKNNLQTIASLLRLQARRSRSPEVKAALKESVNRILSISVVHEFLSQQEAEWIDVIQVTKNVLRLIRQHMVDPEFSLETRFSGPEIILPSQQASNLALIVNELILNALEHAFSHRKKGCIGLHTEQTETEYILEFYDDGQGLPKDFDVTKSKSLGLQIVRTLVAGDMQGTFQLFTADGTHARITIPRQVGEAET